MKRVITLLIELGKERVPPRRAGGRTRVVWVARANDVEARGATAAQAVGAAVLKSLRYESELQVPAPAEGGAA